MANPGVGPKFLSGNLNKSHGQSGHSSSSNGSYGSGRGRTGGYAAGGGGMVVLSRPRSSHKTGPKVFVPPPVNLPSLRKEHERFDPLGSGSGSAGGAGSGSGSASSATGWSKPNVVTSADGEGVVDAFPPATEDWDLGRQSADGSSKSSSIYAPMAARPGTTGSNHSTPVHPRVTGVLRGEDFPSLRATISSAIAQKSSLHQNQRHGMIEESSGAQREGSHLSSGISTDAFLLPPVRLSPRSDWADDERDTSHGFCERNRDHRFSKTEPYWDGDFDFPRSSILPHKPAQSVISGWTRHEDDDVSGTLPTEASTLGPGSRGIRPASREGSKGNSWRAPPSKDGLTSQELSDRSVSAARSNNENNETVKVNKYLPPQVGGRLKGDNNPGRAAGRDNTFGRGDVGYGRGGRQQWHKSAESFSGRGAERSVIERNVSVPESNRHRVESFQGSFAPKAFLSTASEGLGAGSSLNSAKEKCSFSRSERPYTEDWGNASFDDFETFGGNLLEPARRKKDASEKVDFHDPVRESFEAEHQRVIEEQERALKLVQKEEEERLRIAREQEENHRRMEEEVREAARRAEQERSEAARSAEEQKIAREDEKRRMMMEEERRKLAAKQKLQELEERIARKQAEATSAHSSASAVDQRMPEEPRERDAGRADELSDWEDCERMVERIISSAPSDSSSWNRSYDVGSRAYHLKDVPFALPDRGKSNSWRQDANENSSSSFSSEQCDIYHSPRLDAFAGGRDFSRYGTNGYIASGAYHSGGFSGPQLNDPYGRYSEFGSGFNGVAADRFGGMGWN